MRHVVLHWVQKPGFARKEQTLQNVENIHLFVRETSLLQARTLEDRDAVVCLFVVHGGTDLAQAQGDLVSAIGRFSEIN